MANYKVYAVLRGRIPGLYYTYDECKQQVSGFSNAAFKGFQTEQEALSWLAAGGLDIKNLAVGGAGDGDARLENQPAAASCSARKNQTPVSHAAPEEHFAAVSCTTQGDAEAFFQKDHLDTKVLPPVMPENYAFVDGSYNADHNGKPVYGYGGILHVGEEEIVVRGHGSEEEYVVSHQIPGEVFGCLAAIEKAVELGVEHLVIFYDYAGIGHWVTSEKRWKAEKPIAREYVKRYDAVSEKIRVNFYHVKSHTDIEGNEAVDRIAKQEVGLL